MKLICLFAIASTALATSEQIYPAGTKAYLDCDNSIWNLTETFSGNTDGTGCKTFCTTTLGAVDSTTAKAVDSSIGLIQELVADDATGCTFPATYVQTATLANSTGICNLQVGSDLGFLIAVPANVVNGAWVSLASLTVTYTDESDGDWTVYPATSFNCDDSTVVNTAATPVTVKPAVAETPTYAGDMKAVYNSLYTAGISPTPVAFWVKTTGVYDAASAATLNTEEKSYDQYGVSPTCIYESTGRRLAGTPQTDCDECIGTDPKCHWCDALLTLNGVYGQTDDVTEIKRCGIPYNACIAAGTLGGVSVVDTCESTPAFTTSAPSTTGAASWVTLSAAGLIAAAAASMMF